MPFVPLLSPFVPKAGDKSISTKSSTYTAKMAFVPKSLLSPRLKLRVEKRTPERPGPEAGRQGGRDTWKPGAGRPGPGEVRGLSFWRVDSRWYHQNRENSRDKGRTPRRDTKTRAGHENAATGQSSTPPKGKRNIGTHGRPGPGHLEGIRIDNKT